MSRMHVLMLLPAVRIPTSLLARYGSAVSGRARFRRGPGWSDAITDMLVSQAVAHMLDVAAEDPDDPLARGLCVNLELEFLH